MQSVAPGQEPNENEIYVELLAPAEYNRVELPAGSKLWLPRAVVKSMMVRGQCKPASTVAAPAEPEVGSGAAAEEPVADETKVGKSRGFLSKNN